MPVAAHSGERERVAKGFDPRRRYRWPLETVTMRGVSPEPLHT